MYACREGNMRLVWMDILNRLVGNVEAEGTMEILCMADMRCDRRMLSGKDGKCHGQNTKFYTGRDNLIYTACMSYGDKLSSIVESIPNESGKILDELSDKTKDSRRLARKVTYYMEDTKDV